MPSIAVAQTAPVPGDVTANVAEHLLLARAAAERGARAVVFPELSLTGYEMNLARDLAFTIDDARLTVLVDAAATLKTLLVVGVPVRVGTSLHIGAVVLSPDRSVAVYTKQRLGAFSSAAAVDGVVPPAEASVFTAGTLNPLVEIGGARAALAICADTGRPEHAEAAARRGATVYLASMFVIPSEFDRETAALKEYARRHRLFVAMANYGAPAGGLAAAGRSSIWSPSGDLLAQLEPSGTGVALAAAG